jgi:1-acyl-sn-glycerol-3-phosphate acyltransferase
MTLFYHTRPRHLGYHGGVHPKIARLLLSAVGWREDGAIPAESKYVLIAAPHTSNYDLPIMLLISWIYGVKVSWMGKHTLFKPPFGRFFRAMGGIPVDRRAPQGLVAQMAEVIEREDVIALVVPPEGTRSHSDTWKSGFYRIAKAANVPIVLGYLDYQTKRGGFGPVINTTDDIAADMDRIRAFYADKAGLYPAQVGPVELRGESAQRPADQGENEDEDRPLAVVLPIGEPQAG